MPNTTKALPTLLCTLALACLAQQVQAAGFQLIEVPADAQGPALKGAVWSPCSTPPGAVKQGLITLTATQDCAVAGNNLPLVVVSHGKGGSFLGHNDTAQALADAGYVVAAISHFGDSRQDPERAQQGRVSAFLTRPADMRRLVDYMTTQWPQHASLDAQAIGFFGFSRGGYTGLVAAGAVPEFAPVVDLCVHGPASARCEELGGKNFPALPGPDPRIKAAVIVDPLNLFTAQGLASVRIPVALWASELGGDGVTPQSVEAVRASVPTIAEYHVAEHGGHFAYLAPCPVELAQSLPAVCQDAQGFDRTAFHAFMNGKVVAFFNTQFKRNGVR